MADPKNKYLWGTYLQDNTFPKKAEDVVLDKSYGNYPVYTDGMKAGTQQCAAFSNKQMRDLGFDVWGNAWTLHTGTGPGLVLSGYNGLDRPEDFDRQALIQYNHQAADNFKQQFDVNRLNKNAQYAVNMFFNGQPRQAERDAYYEGGNVAGTHTGMLHYNNETGQWELVHNIHGRVYVEPLEGALGSNTIKDRWGITALYNMGNFNRRVPQEDINAAYNAGKISNYAEPPALPISYYQDGGELNPAIVQDEYSLKIPFTGKKQNNLIRKIINGQYPLTSEEILKHPEYLKVNGPLKRVTINHFRKKLADRTARTIGLSVGDEYLPNLDSFNTMFDMSNVYAPDNENHQITYDDGTVYDKDYVDMSDLGVTPNLPDDEWTRDILRYDRLNSSGGYRSMAALKKNKDLLKQMYNLSDEDFNNIAALSHVLMFKESTLGNKDGNPVYNETTLRTGDKNTQRQLKGRDLLYQLGIKEFKGQPVGEGTSWGLGNVKLRSHFTKKELKDRGYLKNVRKEQPEGSALSTFEVTARSMQHLKDKLAGHDEVLQNKDLVNALVAVSHNQGWKNIDKNIERYLASGDLDELSQYQYMSYSSAVPELLSYNNYNLKFGGILKRIK